MRELKFRAWDETAKEFNYFKAGDGFVIPNHQTIMQYTGLKDANNVEIYEGDILETSRHKGKSIYTIIVKDIRYLQCEMFGSNLDYNLVIGNIHENPELL